MNISKDMAKIVYNALDEKKAEDIVVIEVDQVSVLADYFIIANGTNPSQVTALVDNVEESLSKAGYEPNRIEGIGNKNWVLLDYGDVIIHVFAKEDREFYNLERLWRDGKTVSLEELEV